MRVLNIAGSHAINHLTHEWPGLTRFHCVFLHRPASHLRVLNLVASQDRVSASQLLSRSTLNIARLCVYDCLRPTLSKRPRGAHHDQPSPTEHSRTNPTSPVQCPAIHAQNPTKIEQIRTRPNTSPHNLPSAAANSRQATRNSSRQRKSADFDHPNRPRKPQSPQAGPTPAPDPLRLRPHQPTARSPVNSSPTTHRGRSDCPRHTVALPDQWGLP